MVSAVEWGGIMEKKYYVYVWFYHKGESAIPFYVGLSGNADRMHDTINRSDAFKKVMQGHEDSYVKKIAWGMTIDEASAIERVIKHGIEALGYEICDAEENRAEHQLRTRKGREENIYKDGSRCKSAKTGNFCGRPAAYDVISEEMFNLVYGRVKRKEMTNKQAAETLEIGYTTWYRLIDWYVGSVNGGSSYKKP